MPELHFTHDVCTHCDLIIAKGEEVHPTVTPFHVRCPDHDQCYVLCVDDHPEYIEWYTKRFNRAPVQRIKRDPGWYGKYPDWEYVPCTSCRYIDPVLFHTGPGVPIHFASTVHPSSCPTLPHLTLEQERELREKLEEIDRARRRAWADSWNHVIG